MAGGGLATTLVLAAVILTKIFIIGGPGQANDVGVRLVEIVDGDTLSVNVDCLYAVNAFYGWEQDETEDGVVSFTAREARASFIHPNDLVDLRVPLEGLKEVWVCGRAGLAERHHDLLNPHCGPVRRPHPLCRRRHCRGEPGP